MSYALHLARHHLSLTQHQPEPRQPYEDVYRLACTLPADLLAPLARALEAESQLRLCNPAYDPEWYARNPRGIHPHTVMAWHSGTNPAREAVGAASTACWAWLSAPAQLPLFELTAT